MFATPNEAIVYSLRASRGLFHRLIDGLKPHEFEHQLCEGANSAAWVVGHLALTDRRILTRLGVADLPALPPGFEERFGMTKAKAGSQAGLGDPKELIGLFDAHRERLIEAARTADPAKLTEPVPSASGAFADAGEAALFMGLHTSMHVGQLTLIRRSLGYPPTM